MATTIRKMWKKKGKLQFKWKIVNDKLQGDQRGSKVTCEYCNH